MTLQRTPIRFLIALLATAFFCDTATAHGGVVEEDDMCIIKVNFLRAHFKVYQPRVSGHEQFCEDLPVAAESVFVMEYQHDALMSMPIDFRIIRNVTGKGRFARMENIEQIADLDGATVLYQAATVEPDVFTIIHEFESDGEFIGIVRASSPETHKVYAAVFPFSVGDTGLGYWPFFIGALLLLQVQYLAMSGRLKKWMKPRSPGAAGSLLLCVLLLVPFDTVPAADETLRVSYTTTAGPVEINKIHSWILHIESADGAPVVGAEVEVSGSMPAHAHGLPTNPRITEELGGGDYRLEGMRFHMHGYWEIKVTVDTEETSSTVVIPLQL